MAVKTDMNREIDRVLLSEEQIRQRVGGAGRPAFRGVRRQKRDPSMHP